MKFKKVKEYYKKVKSNPTLKKAREEFKQNIGSIKKGESKIKYKQTKFDKRISNIKTGIDIGLGYQKPLVKKIKTKVKKRKRKGGKK